MDRCHTPAPSLHTASLAGTAAALSSSCTRTWAPATAWRARALWCHISGILELTLNSPKLSEALSSASRRHTARSSSCSCSDLPKTPARELASVPTQHAKSCERQRTAPRKLPSCQAAWGGLSRFRCPRLLLVGPKRLTAQQCSSASLGLMVLVAAVVDTGVAARRRTRVFCGLEMRARGCTRVILSEATHNERGSERASVHARERARVRERESDGRTDGETQTKTDDAEDEGVKPDRHLECGAGAQPSDASAVPH